LNVVINITVWPIVTGLKSKPSHYRHCTGPEGSRRLRLPDFKTFGT